MRLRGQSPNFISSVGWERKQCCQSATKLYVTRECDTSLDDGLQVGQRKRQREADVDWWEQQYNTFAEKLTQVKMNACKSICLEHQRPPVSQSLSINKEEEGKRCPVCPICIVVLYCVQFKCGFCAQEDTSQSESSADEEVPTPGLNRDGTKSTGTREELQLARELAEGRWGRFGGRKGKLARIRDQEAALTAKLQGHPACPCLGVLIPKTSQASIEAAREDFLPLHSEDTHPRQCFMSNVTRCCDVWVN